MSCYQRLTLVSALQLLIAHPGASHSVTLRIERLLERRRTRIRVCGEFRTEHIDQVKAELTSGGRQAALDLDEVDLVDIECIRFLNGCESAGVSILHCSPYIREWMVREGGGSKARRRNKNKIENGEQK